MKLIEREWFVFYRSFYEATRELPESEQLAIYNAIAEYSFTLVEPQLEWIAKTIWILIKPQIEANNRRYLNWKKSKTEAKPKQTKSKTVTKEKEKEKDKDKDKDKDIKKENKFLFGFTSLDWKKYKEQEEFIELWEDFIKMRKQIKAPLTQRASKILLKQWEQYKYEVFFKMIEQSIERGWRWIFPIKEEKNEYEKWLISQNEWIAKYEKEKAERAKRYWIKD